MSTFSSDNQAANEASVQNQQNVSDLSSTNTQAIQQSAEADPPLTAEAASEFLLGSREGTLGLMVSYAEDGTLEHQAFTYDQALAGIELVREGKLTEANKIFEFYNSHWDGSGFFTVYNSQSDGGAQIEQSKIMGPNAFIGLFALHYYLSTGDRRGVDLGTS